jgi:hypothetical protein
MWTDFVWLLLVGICRSVSNAVMYLSFPNMWGISLMAEKVNRCASIEVERLDWF